LNAGQLAFPFRRFQIGKVYRGERAQRGRFREFYQADIDVIGDGALDIINDAEMPSIIYRAFTALGLRRFVIRINNRKLLSGLFALMGVETEKAGDVMRIIDKLEKIGREKVAALLVELGLAQDKADALLDLLTCSDRGEDPLQQLDAFASQNEQFDAGLNELRTVASLMAGFGVPETHFKIDLTIARGLDYYTGTVYETHLLDHPEIGSICSGGRYDNLAGYYTDRKLPGVGLSIGLTRLFFVLQDQGYLSPSLLTAPADVLVIPMTEDFAPAVQLATALREAGLRTQIYSENKKFKARLQYADKLGIPFVVFLGEDEINSGKITVKDMASGEQTTASPTMLISGMLQRVAALREGAPIRDKGGE
ncbi:MAG TPA: histidine--tRNA ligase, partial [Papillibacter sp.]|nr:histidine--tRNA ligase [Papillibacter sp.]